MEKTYYLFGQAAVDAYYENEDPQAVLDMNDSYGVFCYDPDKTTPSDLLFHYDGWMGFYEIPEAHYKLLKHY